MEKFKMAPQCYDLNFLTRYPSKLLSRKKGLSGGGGCSWYISRVQWCPYKTACIHNEYVPIKAAMRTKRQGLRACVLVWRAFRFHLRSLFKELSNSSSSRVFFHPTPWDHWGCASAGQSCKLVTVTSPARLLPPALQSPHNGNSTAVEVPVLLYWRLEIAHGNLNKTTYRTQKI